MEIYFVVSEKKYADDAWRVNAMHSYQLKLLSVAKYVSDVQYEILEYFLNNLMKIQAGLINFQF
jgi:hypothetical protein